MAGVLLEGYMVVGRVGRLRARCEHKLVGHSPK